MKAANIEHQPEPRSLLIQEISICITTQLVQKHFESATQNGVHSRTRHTQLRRLLHFNSPAAVDRKCGPSRLGSSCGVDQGGESWVSGGQLGLPLEVYESASSVMALIQQRSPVVKMIEFATKLADYVAASGKKHVIVLSSLDFGRWQRLICQGNNNDKWFIPISWKTVYGPPVDMSLF